MADHLTEESPPEDFAELAHFFGTLGIKDPHKRLALAGAAINPTLVFAAKVASRSPLTVGGWRGTISALKQTHDKDFEKCWQIAEEMFVARLEQEAIKRATAGKKDRNAADLMKFLLRANKAKYQDKKHHSFDNTGGVLHTEIRLHTVGEKDDE